MLNDYKNTLELTDTLKNKGKTKKVDPTLCIFSITIFSYATAYLIEWIDAMYYNYDFNLIEIGINQLIYNNASVILTYLSILMGFIFFSFMSNINAQHKIYRKLVTICEKIKFIKCLSNKKKLLRVLLIIYILLLVVICVLFYKNLNRNLPDKYEFFAIALCFVNGYWLCKVTFGSSHGIKNVVIMCIFPALLLFISFATYRVKQLESPLFEQFNYQNNKYILIKLYDKNIIGKKIEKINGINYWTENTKVLYIPREKLEDYTFTLINAVKKEEN